MTAPVEGQWYWVRRPGGDWFPALRDSGACGGWSNDDTWEDFQGEITEWVLIGPPPEDVVEKKA